MKFDSTKFESTNKPFTTVAYIACEGEPAYLFAAELEIRTHDGGAYDAIRFGTVDADTKDDFEVDFSAVAFASENLANEFFHRAMENYNTDASWDEEYRLDAITAAMSILKG